MMLINPFIFNSSAVLLLKFEGANGSTTFIDSSQYGHSVNVFGSPSPTIQNNSLYVTGAVGGVYVNLNDEFNLTTYDGDFTIEVIINAVVADGSYRGLIGRRWNGADNDWVIYVSPDGHIVFLADFTDSTELAVTHQTAIVANADTHIAAVRAGGIIYLYVNGVKSNASIDMRTKTIKTNLVTVMTHIGKLSFNFPGDYSFEGYIKELRIKKEAVYTAAFTPPTSLF